MKYLSLILIILACSSQTEISVPESKPDKCKITLDETKSHLHWVAFKNSSIPVVGVHYIKGEVNGDLTDLDLNLDFQPNAVNTHIPIRDERLVTYLFTNGGIPKLEFIVNEFEVDSIPEIGNTANATLIGKVTIADKEIEIKVPTYITTTDKGYFITSPAERLVFDVRNDLGLGSRLDELMKVASVIIEDTISIHFELHLIKGCVA